MRWQVGGGDHRDPVSCVSFEMLYDHPQPRGLVHWEKKAYATFTVQPRRAHAAQARRRATMQSLGDVPCLVRRVAPANRNVKGHASRDVWLSRAPRLTKSKRASNPPESPPPSLDPMTRFGSTELS